MMRNSVVLPVMGVLTVIAGAFGLQLGESAIAQIDPVHFSGPRPPVRDVSHDRPPQPQATYASAYGWAEGYGARAADCGDCPAPNAQAAYAPLSRPAADRADREAWRAPITFERAYYEEPADPREWREISRYVHYPVTDEQARSTQDLPSDAPAPAAAELAAEPLEPAGL